jgi:hypothetical protein
MMSSDTFGCREEPDLITAWANAFLRLRRMSGREIAPFAVSVYSPAGIALPDSLGHPLVRALDRCLDHDRKGYQPVETVAFTIFPERIWKLCAEDRTEFYREAMLNLRTFTSWEPTKNRGGMYFGRLFGFGVDHKTGRPLGYEATTALDANGNQIEHVIRQLTKAVRRGKNVARMQLQAATFDPFRDLTTSGQPAFPCLQHIAFNTDVKNRALELNAFYATQQLYVKAYGNWLGLCRLGAFVAAESGFRLTRFTCFAGVQKMDKAPRAGPASTALVREAERVCPEPASKSKGAAPAHG